MEKPLWKMTAEELSTKWLNRYNQLHKNLGTSGAASQTNKEMFDERGCFNIFAKHLEIVRRAVADGKPVPAAVLASYPELKQGEPLVKYLQSILKPKEKTQ